MLSEIHHRKMPHLDSPAIDPGIVDSKRLQMFYVAVKEGSFAAAAHLLGVSPSAISHAIKGLEEDLGCSLFRRSGPQVKPTGAGVRLLPMVEDLLLRMSSMKNELAELDGRSESLVFGLPAALHCILRTGMLSSFRECFPTAHLEILTPGDGLGAVSGKQPDFEIGYLHDVPTDAVRRELVNEELRVYAAPFHRLGQRTKISVAELRQSLLIFPDRPAFQLVVRHLTTGADPELRSWILPNPTSALRLAQQGQGLAFLPEWSVTKALKEGTLTNLKMPGDELRRICCAWWEPSRPLTWVAEVFLSLLAAEFEKRSGPEN